MTPKALFEHYDLISKVPTQYDQELGGNDGLVAIDLDEPTGTHGTADDEEA